MRELAPGAEVADRLAPYAAVRRQPPGRCWVMAHMVGGLDGSAAIGGKVGALSTDPDSDLFVQMRALADIVLVGAETVRRESYGPVRLRPERMAAREAAGRTPVPPLAVVTRSLDLDLSASAFVDAAPQSPTVVITCAAADAGRLEVVGRAAEVVLAGDDRVDPAVAMAALFARGHRVVLCEGGPRWLGELVEADLVDELCLTISPIMGGDPLPVSVTPPGGSQRTFTLRHVLREDDTIFLRYERVRDE